MLAIAAFLPATAHAASLQPGTAAESFSWTAFLGPFHTLALHLPIGFIAAAVLFEVLQWRWPRPGHDFVIRVLLLAAFISGTGAVVTGLLRAQEGGFDVATVTQHRNAGYALLAMVLITLGASWQAGHRPQHRASRLFYRGSLGLCLAAISLAGHLGGNLTHGSTFLTANAPAFLKRLLEGPPPEALASTGAPRHGAARSSDPGTTNGPAGVAANDPGVQFYLERIKPVFSSRCYSCHGAEKHKGKYRLDVRESALRGGESGVTAVESGDPLKSELFRRLLLPRQHDEAMPPDGKQPLTAQEILDVASWIQQGAPFP